MSPTGTIPPPFAGRGIVLKLTAATVASADELGETEGIG
jgi:hypothetical protein